MPPDVTVVVNSVGSNSIISAISKATRLRLFPCDFGGDSHVCLRAGGEELKSLLFGSDRASDMMTTMVYTLHKRLCKRLFRGSATLLHSIWW